jgi:hypothetical protein
MTTTATPVKDFIIHALHSAAQGVIWIAPLAILAYPKFADLTVSAIVSIAVGYLKSRYFPTS